MEVKSSELFPSPSAGWHLRRRFVKQRRSSIPVIPWQMCARRSPRRCAVKKRTKASRVGGGLGPYPCQLCLHPPPCPDLLDPSLGEPSGSADPKAGDWVLSCLWPAGAPSRVCRAVEQGSAGGSWGLSSRGCAICPPCKPSCCPGRATPGTSPPPPPKRRWLRGPCAAAPRTTQGPQGRGKGKGSSSPTLYICKSPAFNPDSPGSRAGWGVGGENNLRLKRQILPTTKGGSDREPRLQRRSRAARRPRKPLRAQRGAACPASPPPRPAAPPAGAPSGARLALFRRPRPALPGAPPTPPAAAASPPAPGAVRERQ